MATAIRIRNFVLYVLPVFLLLVVVLDTCFSGGAILALKQWIVAAATFLITFNIFHHYLSYTLLLLPEFRGILFTNGRPNGLFTEFVVVHALLLLFSGIVFLAPFTPWYKGLFYVIYIILLQCGGQFHIGAHNFGVSLLLHQNLAPEQVAAHEVRLITSWERAFSCALPAVILLPFTFARIRGMVPMTPEFYRALRLFVGASALLLVFTMLAFVFRNRSLAVKKVGFSSSRWFLMALVPMNPFSGQMENLVHAIEHHVVIFQLWKRSAAKRKWLLALAGAAFCVGLGALFTVVNVAMIFRQELWKGIFDNLEYDRTTLVLLAFVNFWAFGHFYVSARIFRFSDRRVREAGVPKLFENYGL